MAMVKHGEVYWVNLDPTLDTEINKTGPALIISPNDLNDALPRFIVAPITSKSQPLGCRPEVEFDGRSVCILLDQTRSVDKRRLLGKMGGNRTPVVASGVAGNACLNQNIKKPGKA